MSKSQDLLTAYEQLDWDLYVQLADGLCKVDRHDIEEELVSFPRVFSYYSGLYEYARQDVAKWEARLEKMTAELKREAADQLKSAGTRPTVDAVMTRVNVSEDLYIFKEDLEVRKGRLGLLKSLVSGMQSKKDMLVQISANSRAEIQLAKG